MQRKKDPSPPTLGKKKGIAQKKSGAKKGGRLKEKKGEHEKRDTKSLR